MICEDYLVESKTAGEVIAAVDALRPNPYPAAQKLDWLRTLDGKLQEELTHNYFHGRFRRPTARARSCSRPFPTTGSSIRAGSSRRSTCTTARS